MKFLYALVSAESDIYYEQTLASIVSLRYHNPKAFVSLLVDDGTDKTLVGFRAKIQELVQEYKVVAYPKELSNMMRSRYLKTEMRKHVSGDFLYLDGDTAVVDFIGDDSFRDFGDVAAVADLHAGRDDKYRVKHKRFNESLRRLGFSLDLRDLYFNSGILFAKDSPTAHAFFEKWHELYRYCNRHQIYTDQFSLNESNRVLDFPIRELPGEWNCQVREAYNHLYRVKTIYPILCKAKIVHFFGSGIDGKREPHPLMKKSFFEEIKCRGGLDEKSLQIICHAKTAFFGAPETLRADVSFPRFFLYRQFPRLCSLFMRPNHLYL